MITLAVCNLTLFLFLVFELHRVPEAAQAKPGVASRDGVATNSQAILWIVLKSFWWSNQAFAIWGTTNSCRGLMGATMNAVLCIQGGLPAGVTIVMAISRRALEASTIYQTTTQWYGSSANSWTLSWRASFWNWAGWKCSLWVSVLLFPIY